VGGEGLGCVEWRKQSKFKIAPYHSTKEELKLCCAWVVGLIS